MNAKFHKITEPDLSQLKITFPKCQKPGHNNSELKFIDKAELQDIKHAYCSVCVEEIISQSKGKSISIVSMHHIIKEVAAASQTYMSNLEPILDDFYRKQQEISETDF